MAGAIIIVVVILVVLPVGFLMGGGVLAGIIGSFLTSSVAKDHEGSELLDTNV